MGDSNPSGDQQISDIFDGLKGHAPQLIDILNKSLAPSSQSQLAAEQGVAGGYNDLYNQNQLAAGNTEANVVEGPGSRLVTAANKEQQALDPEYYTQRGNISQALSKYLGGYDPNTLSPTEVAQISRGINATTGPITPSAQNTIKNAATFGSAATDRWKNFGTAVTQAAGVLPTLKSGLTGFDIAKTRGQDTGASGSVANSLNLANSIGTAGLGASTAGANAALAKRKDIFDQVLSATQSLNNVASAAGSFAGA